MIELVATLLAMVVLLLLEGFFSGSEIALVNADKLKLRNRARKGEGGARLVLKLFEHPERLLATTLIGTNIAMVTFTTLGTVTLIRWLGAFGDLVALLLLTPLVLVFGEVVPKSVYQQKADSLAPFIIFPLRLFSWLLFPLIFVFSQTARLVAYFAGRGTPKHLFVAREKMRLLLDSAEQAGDDAIIDRQRIRRALRFGGIRVSEAMIPLREMVTVSIGHSLHHAINLVRKHGFNRLPVYESDTSQVVGVVSLSTWDLLESDLAEKPLSEFVRPVQYVAANQPVELLLPLLQQREDHLAIVVDEFGSAVGLITLEDILEEVVGEIEDVDFRIYNPRHRRYRRIGPSHYELDARLSTTELNELLGLDLPSREFHSVGGLLTAHLQHIPRSGEYVETAGYRFIVLTADDRTALTVEVQPVSPAAPPRLS